MENAIKEFIESKTKYYNAKNKFDECYAELWLNTNWEEVLGNKKPTIKDKESWIKLDPSYQSLLKEKQDCECNMDYCELMLNVKLGDDLL